MNPMMLAAILLTLLVGALVGLNFVVTQKLWKSDSCTTKQKWAQMVLVWAIPFLGALLVWAVAKEAIAGNRLSPIDAAYEPELAGLYSSPESLGASHGGHDFHFGEH